MGGVQANTSGWTKSKRAIVAGNRTITPTLHVEHILQYLRQVQNVHNKRIIERTKAKPCHSYQIMRETVSWRARLQRSVTRSEITLASYPNSQHGEDGGAYVPIC